MSILVSDLLNSAIPIINGELYFLVVDDGFRPPTSEKYLFFTTDNTLIYTAFFADFGPLNLGLTHQFCLVLENHLKSCSSQNKIVVYYCQNHPHKRSNSATLLCAFLVFVKNCTAEQAYNPFFSIEPPFTPFRDAAFCINTFPITVLDCARAFAKAVQCGHYSYRTFSVTTFSQLAKLENGDFSWIIPGKFIAFSGPVSRPREIANGLMTLSPEEYVPKLKELGVTCIIRFNTKCYDKAVYTKAGIRHVDLYYEDGGNPSDAILQSFLQVCEQETGAIAVHCKAGLGRTGTNIAAYMIKHYDYTAKETVAWCRVCRPGSVVGPQQQYLAAVESRMKSEGAAARKQSGAGSGMVTPPEQGRVANRAKEGAAGSGLGTPSNGETSTGTASQSSSTRLPNSRPRTPPISKSPPLPVASPAIGPDGSRSLRAKSVARLSRDRGGAGSPEDMGGDVDGAGAVVTGTSGGIPVDLPRRQENNSRTSSQSQLIPIRGGTGGGTAATVTATDTNHHGSGSGSAMNGNGNGRDENRLFKPVMGLPPATGTSTTTALPYAAPTHNEYSLPLHSNSSTMASTGTGTTAATTAATTISMIQRNFSPIRPQSSSGNALLVRGDGAGSGSGSGRGDGRDRSSGGIAGRGQVPLAAFQDTKPLHLPATPLKGDAAYGNDYNNSNSSSSSNSNPLRGLSSTTTTTTGNSNGSNQSSALRDRDRDRNHRAVLEAQQYRNYGLGNGQPSSPLPTTTLTAIGQGQGPGQEIAHSRRGSSSVSSPLAPPRPLRPKTGEGVSTSVAVVRSRLRGGAVEGPPLASIDRDRRSEAGRFRR